MFKKNPNQTNKTTKPLSISLSNSKELKINSQVSFVPRQQIKTNKQKKPQQISSVDEKAVIYMQFLYKGKLFNEEYTLSAIILCVVIQTEGNEAAKADVVVQRTV